MGWGSSHLYLRNKDKNALVNDIVLGSNLMWIMIACFMAGLHTLQLGRIAWEHRCLYLCGEEKSIDEC